MKHLVAILFKFIITAIVLEILLGILTTLSFGEIIAISAVVTIFSYLIVDLIILSASNNSVASLSDAALSFVIVYLFNYVPGYGIVTIGASLISAVVIGVFEWFFHRYMVKTVYPNRKKEY